MPGTMRIAHPGGAAIWKLWTTQVARIRRTGFLWTRNDHRGRVRLIAMSHPGQPPDSGADQNAGMGPRPQGPSFDAPSQGRWGGPPTSGGYRPGQPNRATQPGQQPFDPAIPTYRMSSDQFRPPRDNKPLWIVGIVVGVILLVVATSTLVAWRSDLRQQNNPSPTPTIPTALPTPSGNGIDFVSSGEGSGRLEITGAEWTTTGLQVKLRMSVTDGEVQYGLYNFQAFDELGNLYDSSIQEVPEPALGEGYLTEGQTTEGWLGFQVTRQDVTLLLISEYGKAITAYKIDG